MNRLTLSGCVNLSRILSISPIKLYHFSSIRSISVASPFHCKMSTGDEMPFGCCPKETPVEPECGTDDSPVISQILCDASELPEGGKKEVEANGRKLLLINEKGTLYCINALCTHYNFPLINGTFVDGKVRCPLHGACFNLRNGDIEEYPGFDALNSYQVKKENGKIVLKTTEKRLNSDRRTRRVIKFNEKKEHPIIVIGGGPSADTLTEHLRLLGCNVPLIMITAEAFPPYDRVLLSKNFGVEINGIRHRSDEFYNERKINVKTNTRVVAVDTADKKIQIQNGEILHYSKLVIATGGSVRKLTDPGSKLKNIYYIREYTDIVGLAANAEGKDVVCIGGSFIGMECASTIRATAKSVTVVCSTEEPLPAFGKDIGSNIRKYFESKGVQIITKGRVASFEGDSDGTVSEVKLVGGATVPAQIVIAGIGVAPSTDFIRSSNIKMDARGFIMVNADFQTSDPHVYSIGDVCSFPLAQWGRDHINIQHFQVAQKHGELAAHSMLHKKQPTPLVPFFWSLWFFEKGCRFTGLADDYDEIYTRGSLEDFSFTKYFIKNGTVVAVCDAGMPTSAIPFTQIFKKGISVSKDEVEKNIKDDWSHYL